jgi:hypothetical protein
MKTLLTILTLIYLSNIQQENVYVGTWEYYDIRSFKNKYPVTQKEFDNLKSQIIFNSDLTFKKTTNGKLTEGKYEYTSSTFKFYETDRNEKLNVSWSIKAPKNSKVDLNYPELFTVTDKKGKLIQVELDVYYKKLK